MTSLDIPRPEHPDPVTELAHRVIRAYNGDDFAPFMVPGCADRGRIERHCFYYSLLVEETITVLLDNGGRGGMCELIPEEIGAVWLTETLLHALGVTLAELSEGSAVLGTGPVPRPMFDRNADLRDLIRRPITLPAEIVLLTDVRATR